MEVKFFDSSKEYDVLIKDGLMEEIESVIRKGNCFFDEKTRQLEDTLSEYFNSNSITVGNGTEAIYLALKAYGIGSGDRVAVPSFSAIPTVAAVESTGAEVVYVDVNINNCAMDFSLLKKEKDLSAVVYVHLFGLVSDQVKDISIYCKNNNIFLVEDCAQAFGSINTYGMAGTFGDVGTFSFYPTKTVGVFGDCGGVISQRLDIIEKIKEIRFYGQKSKYVMGDEFGINSRTDEIQATILLKKLQEKYFIPMIEKRIEMLCEYKKYIHENTNGNLLFGLFDWEIGNVPHLFPILVKNRKNFMRKMKEKNIETLIHYPFTLTSLCKRKYIERYPGAEFISKHIVSIPFHPWLSNEEIKYILDNVSEILS